MPWKSPRRSGTGVGDGPPDSAANTVDFPLTFRSQSSGCPTSDPTIQTDSSFSLEHFLPSAVDASCKGPDGVVALNTATDNQSDISNLKTGGAQISFIDDPGDPNQSQCGKSYAYVPVALSATVVGFLAAQNFEGQIPYPLSEYKLTPNMVAGLITSEYQTADGSPKQVGNDEVPGFSDNLIPPLKCADLINCPNDQGYQVYNELDYNTFNLLNPSPTNVTGPQSFGSFMSNISTGSSYQVTNWICKAPNVPVPVTVDEITTPHGKYHNVKVMATDQNIAGTTLTSAPVGTSIWPPYTTLKQPNGPAWVFPTCQGYATFPSLASSEANYGESQNPSFQAKSIRTFAYGGQVVPGLTNVPYAGFGVMDSSEADFNGLNSADLQNADGTFVYPSAQSIDSAASARHPVPGRPAIVPGRHLQPRLHDRPFGDQLSDARHHLRGVLDQGQRQSGRRGQGPAHQSGDLLPRVEPARGLCAPAGQRLPGRGWRTSPQCSTPSLSPRRRQVPRCGSADGSPGSGGTTAGTSPPPSGLDTGATDTQGTTLPLSTAPKTKSDGHKPKAGAGVEHGPHAHHAPGPRRGVQVPPAHHAGPCRCLPDRRPLALLPARVQAPAPDLRRIGVTTI